MIRKAEGVDSFFGKDVFGKDARTIFLEATRNRFGSMKARLTGKGLAPPFDLDAFRADILAVMGGRMDGALKCRYCGGIFGVDEIAADHAIPLSRGGSLDLDNIDFPCSDCNRIKESLTPDEFLALLEFLDTKIPLAKASVLSRMLKAISLSIGMWRNQAIIDYLKSTGAWDEAKKAVKERKAAKAARKASRRADLGRF
jgi:HNH endonuclease